MTEQQKNKQIQKSGDSSLNIQAEQINIGLSLEDVRTIAQDVYDANFYRLSGVAKEIAKDRAENILNKFLIELKDKNPEGFNMAQDPDFQSALFNVQKEYAKTGDDELGDILVDILIARTKETTRNIKQIVLNECIETAPKLTKNQYATLSIISLLRYTMSLDVTGFADFKKYINRFIAPFIPSLTKNNTCYQHLEYAGCGNIGIGSTKIENILLKTYTGLLVKGFKEEEVSHLLKEEPKLSQFINISLRDNNLIQINEMNDNILHNKTLLQGIDSSIVDKLIAVQKKYIMNTDEVKEFLITLHSCMSNLFDIWENSSMKSMTLTSVGIAIGHANIRRIAHEDIDLSIWINE